MSGWTCANISSSRPPGNGSSRTKEASSLEGLQSCQSGWRCREMSQQCFKDHWSICREQLWLLTDTVTDSLLDFRVNEHDRHSLSFFKRWEIFQTAWSEPTYKRVDMMVREENMWSHKAEESFLPAMTEEWAEALQLLSLNRQIWAMLFYRTRQLELKHEGKVPDPVHAYFTGWKSCNLHFSDPGASAVGSFLPVALQCPVSTWVGRCTE